MFTLTPTTILRPEPQGALLFQPARAETALLDLEGLAALYHLCQPGRRRELPISFAGYLLEKGFIVRGAPDGSAARVEECLEQAKTTTAPPRALAAPETIHFSVTGGCDQVCAGCFYSARPGSAVSAAHAPWDLYARVVREAEQARVFQIALGGGEPLLHPRLVEMVQLARAHHLVPNLTTNGNRLTRDLAAALKQAGLGQVQISLNGASEATNARTRPNFQQALAAVEVCRACGLRFGFNFLVTRSSLDELDAMVELGRRLGAASVNLLRPKPPTTEGDWLERESLDAAGYRRVREVVRQAARHKSQGASRKSQAASRKLQVASRKPQVGSAGDAATSSGHAPNSGTRITLDASLTFLLTDRAPEQLYASGVWGCCAARKFVTILQDGAILPCSHVRWSDASISDGLLRAWRESRVLARFRAREETIRGRCAGCAYLEWCKGCPAVVMAFGGDFDDSDPHCPRQPDCPK